MHEEGNRQAGGTRRQGAAGAAAPAGQGRAHPRKKEVLDALAQGLSDALIAAKLGISPPHRG